MGFVPKKGVITTQNTPTKYPEAHPKSPSGGDGFLEKPKNNTFLHKKAVRPYNEKVYSGQSFASVGPIIFSAPA